MLRIFSLVAACVLATNAFALTCPELQREIASTYGFSPSKLNEQTQQKKSEQMDRVWSAVQAEPTLAPCLKAALQSTNDNWFFFDGSQLLASIDPSSDAKELQYKALTRVSLEDVDLKMWIGSASAFAFEGRDISELGKRWLTNSNSEYFLPEHGAARIDRATGALFLFGAMDERFATPALTELARSAKGEAREIASALLNNQATPETLPAKLPALIEARTSPKTSREEFIAAFNALLAGNPAPFDQLIEAVPDGERDLVAVAKPEDLALLRKVRRYYAATNNPHAIDYYNQFTQILMTLVANAQRTTK